MERVEKKMAYATKWSSLAEIVAKLILPIVNMILARLLVPEDFGIVATVNIVITFAEVFQDAGFQKYMIQHEFKDDDDFNSSANVAFWSNLVLSCFLWGIIGLFRNDISKFISGEIDISLEIVVASFSLPVFAMSSIQTSYYKRNLEFKKLFWVRLITSLIPLIVTVPLALIFRNHWALIIGTLLRNLVQTIVLYTGAKWKPSFKYSFVKLQEMISFCIWTLAESVTIWITANAGVFIVTRILGSQYVGYYKTSMSAVSSVISIVSAATVSVLFSSLSRVQNDLNRFMRIFENYQMTIGMLVIPMGVGMFLYRDLLTLILLGRQWMVCAEFIGIYSLANALAIVTNSFFSEMYRALGKPKISMIAQLIYLSFLIPIIYLAANNGFDTLCFGTTITVFGFMCEHFLIVRFVLKIKVGKMLINICTVFIPCFIMSCVGYLMHRVNAGYIWQFSSIALCVVVYFISVLCIKPLRNCMENSELTSGLYRKLKSFFRRKII